MAKPTEVPEFAVDETDNAEPTADMKDDGFADGEVITTSYFNWLFFVIYQWVLYLQAGLFEGAFGLTSAITPSAITGANADYAPTGHATATVIRQGLSAAASLSGLAGPVAGRMVTIINLSGTYDLQLVHDSTSTAANRFSLPEAKDLYLVGAGSYVTLWYDSTLSRWTVIATNGRQPKVLWIAGTEFVPQDSADATLRVYDNGAVLNTQTAPTGFGAPLLMPVGTRLTEVRFYFYHGSEVYSRQMSLTRGQGNGTGSGTTIGSATVTGTTTSTNTTISNMPHTILDTGPYALELAMEDGDLSWGVKVTYY